jgi:hypothetical protein
MALVLREEMIMKCMDDCEAREMCLEPIMLGEVIQKVRSAGSIEIKLPRLRIYREAQKENR